VDLQIIQMAKIKDIIIHHSGGVGADNFASSLFVTPQSISKYHKAKWNSYRPSQYVKDESIRYMGYNVIYDPKTRKFTQGRAIGEETIAARGKNFDSFHLCVIGNYNAKANETVDPVTPEMKSDVGNFLKNLIEGNEGNLLVAGFTDVDLSYYRIFPHRKFTPTMCYGNGLKDDFWAKEVLSEKNTEGQPKIDVTNKELQITLYQQIILLLQQILSLRLKLAERGLAGRDDDENLPGNIKDYL